MGYLGANDAAKRRNLLAAAIRSQHFDPRHIDPNVGSRANQEAFRIDLMARVSFRMKGVTEVVDIEKVKRPTAERLRPRGRNFRFRGWTASFLLGFVSALRMM